MIYETKIDEAVLNCIDTETGVILDETLYTTLQSDAEAYAEELALESKNAKAEAKAIKEEVSKLQMRQYAAEERATRCKAMLKFLLRGEKMKTPRCSVYYQTSKSVNVQADFAELRAIDPDFVRVREEYNKTAIKKALDGGKEIPGCSIEEKVNIVVR